MTGPNYRNLDATLAKQFNLMESLKLEFRLEAYNLTNSFMANNPDLNVQSSRFGEITGQRPAVFGRQLQYGARLRW